MDDPALFGAIYSPVGVHYIRSAQSDEDGPWKPGRALSHLQLLIVFTNVRFCMKNGKMMNHCCRLSLVARTFLSVLSCKN